jgi:hypothetical protein
LTDGGKARAGAANPKRNNAPLDAIYCEALPRFYNVCAASQAGIERAVNEVVDFSVAINRKIG